MVNLCIQVQSLFRTDYFVHRYDWYYTPSPPPITTSITTPNLVSLTPVWVLSIQIISWYSTPFHRQVSFLHHYLHLIIPPPLSYAICPYDNRKLIRQHGFVPRVVIICWNMLHHIHDIHTSSIIHNCLPILPYLNSSPASLPFITQYNPCRSFWYH